MIWTNTHILFSNKLAWGICLALPIPIFSIILGFKYRKLEVNTTKNIVAGIVVGSILLFGGLTYFINPNQIDCSQISTHKQIIGVEFPTNISCIRNEWVGNDFVTETIHVRFTDNKEATAFERKITDNDNWLLKNNLSSTLDTFMPISNMCFSNNCYFLIYAEDIGYNTIPETDGSYKVYVMIYDIATSTLIINMLEE